MRNIEFTPETLSDYPTLATMLNAFAASMLNTKPLGNSKADLLDECFKLKMTLAEIELAQYCECTGDDLAQFNEEEQEQIKALNLLMMFIEKVAACCELEGGVKC